MTLVCLTLLEDFCKTTHEGKLAPVRRLPQSFKQPQFLSSVAHFNKENGKRTKTNGIIRNVSVPNTTIEVKYQISTTYFGP